VTARIVRVRKSGYDEHGDPIDGTARRTLDHAFIAPRTTADLDGRGRHGVTVGVSLFAPYGTDLVHTDQVEIDGELFDVDGEVAQWRNPLTGSNAGAEVALKRAAG
jgi:hypothetical protein